MSHFVERSIKLSVDIGSDIRVTLSRITYVSDRFDKCFVVESGLHTDLGSIPQWLQGIFPKDGKAMFAYILHDGLYKYGGTSKEDADKLLLDAMESLGVTYLRRMMVYNGVKFGGRNAWNGHRENDRT